MSDGSQTKKKVKLYDFISIKGKLIYSNKKQIHSNLGRGDVAQKVKMRNYEETKGNLKLDEYVTVLFVVMVSQTMQHQNLSDFIL